MQSVCIVHRRLRRRRLPLHLQRFNTHLGELAKPRVQVLFG
jgi:hypothetical protein